MSAYYKHIILFVLWQGTWEKKNMKVAVLGYGVVGQGVFRMLQACEGLSCNRVLERPGVCNESYIVNNIEEIISDPEIEAVVECIGGCKTCRAAADDGHALSGAHPGRLCR